VLKDCATYVQKRRVDAVRHVGKEGRDDQGATKPKVDPRVRGHGVPVVQDMRGGDRKGETGWWREGAEMEGKV
jgi:hypothetical protein